MYTKPDKKMIPVLIMKILKECSDNEHPLKQKDILEYLEKDYFMDIDRKSVSINLDRLIEEFPNEIQYSESSTKYKATKKYKKDAKKNEEFDSDISETKTDFYWEHDFDNSELRMLIDSLLFSKYVSHSQCNDLIKKIKNLSSKYFTVKNEHITKLEDTMPKPLNRVEYSIYAIDEAITKNKKIKFNYSSININKEYELKKDKNEKIKEYIVSPYEMIVSNSRYYLICNTDGYDDVGIYRLDRLVNTEVIDEDAKPKTNVKGLQWGLNLPKYAMEHIYMNIGKSERVIFEFDQALLNDVVDWFGVNIELRKKSDEVYEASAIVNLRAMNYWAMQYCEFVKVISPKRLVDTIKKQLDKVIQKYQQ